MGNFAKQILYFICYLTKKNFAATFDLERKLALRDLKKVAVQWFRY
jgi:hypothetical protein